MLHIQQWIHQHIPLFGHCLNLSFLWHSSQARLPQLLFHQSNTIQIHQLLHRLQKQLVSTLIPPNNPLTSFPFPFHLRPDTVKSPKDSPIKPTCVAALMCRHPVLAHLFPNFRNFSAVPCIKSAPIQRLLLRHPALALPGRSQKRRVRFRLHDGSRGVRRKRRESQLPKSVKWTKSREIHSQGLPASLRRTRSATSEKRMACSARTARSGNVLGRC